MPLPDKNKEDELRAALGKPKYFIETTGQKEGGRYFWFPTLGDSMIDGTKRSIESGSLVLGRLIEISSVYDLPLHRPVVIIIKDEGKDFCMLKTVSEVNVEEEKFCLRSYNAKYEDYWLPFWCVQFVFLVERMRKRDGTESDIV